MNIDRNHLPSVQQVLNYKDMRSLLSHLKNSIESLHLSPPPQRDGYALAVKKLKEEIDNYDPPTKPHPVDVRHIDNIKFSYNSGASGYITDYFSVFFDDDNLEENIKKYKDISHLVPFDVSLKVLFFDGCMKNTTVIDIPAYEERVTEVYDIDAFTSYLIEVQRLNGSWDVKVTNNNVKRDYVEILNVTQL